MKFLIALALVAFVRSTYGAKRDVKSDLLAKAETLEKQATDVAKKLTAAGKTAAAARITAEEKRLVTLAAELKAATEDAAVKRLETDVRAIEMRIADELRRIEGTLTTASQRPTVTNGAESTTKTSIDTTTHNSEDILAQQLVFRISKLETIITSEIKLLQSLNKNSLIEKLFGLNVELNNIYQSIIELKKANESEKIKILEGEIELFEFRLQTELTKIENEINGML